MDVTPLIRVGQQIIQSYKSGQFKISGKAYSGPVIVTPERTLDWAAPREVKDLAITHFEALESERPEVILLGTGKTMHFLSSELKKSLKDKGLNIECMDTGAACRTYNVLMAEGRIVAAALLPA